MSGLLSDKIKAPLFCGPETLQETPEEVMVAYWGMGAVTIQSPGLSVSLRRAQGTRRQKGG